MWVKFSPWLPREAGSWEVHFTSLAVFQAKALQNRFFSGCCSKTEIFEQL
jgi:hypothetical protein